MRVFLSCIRLLLFLFYVVLSAFALKDSDVDDFAYVFLLVSIILPAAVADISTQSTVCLPATIPASTCQRM